MLLRLLYGVLTLSLILTSCNGTNDSSESPTNNYVIYIDLSDRLLATSDQIDNDKKIILDILTTFIDQGKKTIVRNNKDFNSLKDKIRVVIGPKQGLTLPIEEYEAKLSLDFERIDKRAINYYFSQGYEDFYLETLNELYAHIANNPDHKVPSGLGIWDYFQAGIEQDLFQGEDYQNYLFLLSDGYIYPLQGEATTQTGNRFNSFAFISQLKADNWKEQFDQGDYGLISTGKVYANLSVMLLEINPKQSSDYDILKEIWTKWLGEMSVAHFQINGISNIGNTREDILAFIERPTTVAEPLLAAKEEPEKTSPSVEQPEKVEPAISEPAATVTPIAEPPAEPAQTVTKTPTPNTQTASEPAKVAQPVVAAATQPKKEAPADLSPIPANISFEDLSAQLNLIADRSQKPSNKKSTRSKILRMCESDQVYVKLFSESNTLVDRYAIKDYLSRIDLLGRYQIEVMSFDKNDNSQIIEIRVRETRI